MFGFILTINTRLDVPMEIFSVTKQITQGKGEDEEKSKHRALFRRRMLCQLAVQIHLNAAQAFFGLFRCCYQVIEASLAIVLPFRRGSAVLVKWSNASGSNRYGLCVRRHTPLTLHSKHKGSPELSCSSAPGLNSPNVQIPSVFQRCMKG